MRRMGSSEGLGLIAEDRPMLLSDDASALALPMVRSGEFQQTCSDMHACIPSSLRLGLECQHPLSSRWRGRVVAMAQGGAVRAPLSPWPQISPQISITGPAGTRGPSWRADSGAGAETTVQTVQNGYFRLPGVRVAGGWPPRAQNRSGRPAG